MKFLKNSKISREIESEVTEEEKVMRLMLCEEEKSILETPWIISSVSDNLKAMKYTSLYQINPFDQPMDGQPIPDKLRVKFYILNIQPYDPREFV